ncbi:MAG: NUDIX hydrolase [Gammaproteobacteria bacterium]|nr:NUDIX hydrolase [Gammaproteobacteria bacterium]
MKFCSECASPVSLRVPEGDNLPRFICDRCGTVHYQNPNMVAGCIAEWQDRILLCKRSIEPRSGLWTLPAGFMENGETTVEAAARETREEACAEVTDLKLYGLFNLPHINQVYLMFRGQLVDGKAAAGPESEEVGLYRREEIPWEQLAFPVIRETLELYYDDDARTDHVVYISDLRRTADRRIEIRRHLKNDDR